MKIEPKEIFIKDISNKYINSDEAGVTGYDGKLNIRPIYQREFVYKDKQRDDVIRSVVNNLPLNVMYWAKNSNDTYELIDGQQRTISICEYINGKFSIDFKYFGNLTPEEKGKILNYKLMVFSCDGTAKDKLAWFKTINTTNVQLTEQELLNAVYSGPWLTDAKKYFSNRSCLAYNLAEKYLTGHVIRQDYLETVLSWISGDKIEDYMAKNQHETTADELVLYFKNVISWVATVFPDYRKEMKGVPFGLLYNKFKNTKFNSKELAKEITKLMLDDDVTKKSGIYQFVLTREQKYLNIRAFTDNQTREAYERQKGICPKCKEHFKIEDMEADHITPWSKGGKTNSKNCQLLCQKDNRIKSSI